MLRSFKIAALSFQTIKPIKKFAFLHFLIGMKVVYHKNLELMKKNSMKRQKSHKIIPSKHKIKSSTAIRSFSSSHLHSSHSYNIQSYEYVVLFQHTILCSVLIAHQKNIYIFPRDLTSFRKWSFIFEDTLLLYDFPGN